MVNPRSATGGAARQVASAAPASQGARLVYEMTSADTLVTEFFVEAPGGKLLSHVKGTVVKKK